MSVATEVHISCSNF